MLFSILIADESNGIKALFELNSRGKTVLVLDGFRYRVNGFTGDKVRWRCTSHSKFGCRAIAHTVQDRVIYLINEHVKTWPDRNKLKVKDQSEDEY
ncbi:FLYWCH-type zinc finger-containing protein 1 [Amyelois transitella]|uniref:FLYWCH-type zinc finger-containing protein 1 n=1 Tax=Amyelois transitella TaxID=680683 RepID=UPI00298FBF6A|nr:FLYWCH-type zinc finger-containing protein 1 [Amyelois transitella]